MTTLVEEVIEQTSCVLRVKFPEVGGGYELTCSPSLIQAVGECSDVDFYFRAKHGHWEFETEDKQGHSFPAGDSRRFALEGRYDEDKPMVMTMDWAARQLRRCLSEWWAVRI